MAGMSLQQLKLGLSLSTSHSALSASVAMDIMKRDRRFPNRAGPFWGGLAECGSMVAIGVWQDECGQCLKTQAAQNDKHSALRESNRLRLHRSLSPICESSCVALTCGLHDTLCFWTRPRLSDLTVTRRLNRRWAWFRD